MQKESRRTVSFKWKIENFTFSGKLLGEYHESPAFRVRGLHCTLRLYPRGKSVENITTVQLVEDETDFFERSVVFRIEDSNGSSLIQSPEFKVSESHTEGQNRAPTVWLVKRDSVVTGEKKLLTCGMLILSCKISFQKYSTTGVTTLNLRKLADDLGVAYEKQLLADLIIDANDGSIPVHEVMLFARAPKLAAMISDSRLDLSRWKTSSVRCLLEYIYTGKLDMEKSDLFEEVAEIANFCGLTDLEWRLCSSVTAYSARTIIGIKKISFTWSICNFKSIGADEKIHSAIVYNSLLDRNKWKITLTSLSTNQIYAQLKRVSPNHVNESVFTLFKVSKVHSTSSIALCEYDHLFLPDEKEWFFSVPLMFSDFFLPDSSLILVFDLIASDSNDPTEISEINISSEQEEIEEINYMRKLALDLGCIWYTGIKSDVDFICEDKRFRVHKTILAARSPVFQKMFEYDKSKEIRINDMSPSTMKSMLAYIYCEKLDYFSHLCDASELFEHVMALYTASDKYELLVLRQQCSEKLQELVTVDNAFSLLVLADMHSDNDLKLVTQLYLSRNWSAVLLSDSWKEFARIYNDLATELLLQVGLSFLDK